MHPICAKASPIPVERIGNMFADYFTAKRCSTAKSMLAKVCSPPGQ